MLWRYQIGKIQNNITYISSGVIYNGSLGTYQYRVSENHWYIRMISISFGNNLIVRITVCCSVNSNVIIKPRIIICLYLLEIQALSSIYILESRLKIIQSFSF